MAQNHIVKAKAAGLITLELHDDHQLSVDDPKSDGHPIYVATLWGCLARVHLQCNGFTGEAKTG